MNIQMFPEVFFHLQVELERHPRLQANLVLMQDSDPMLRLMAIARYCNIDVLPGDYSVTEIEQLAELCLKRLKEAKIDTDNVIDRILDERPKRLGNH